MTLWENIHKSVSVTDILTRLHELVPGFHETESYDPECKTYVAHGRNIFVHTSSLLDTKSPKLARTWLEFHNPNYMMIFTSDPSAELLSNPQVKPTSGTLPFLIPLGNPSYSMNFFAEDKIHARVRYQKTIPNGITLLQEVQKKMPAQSFALGGIRIRAHPYTIDDLLKGYVLTL
jgi:hypothetical protein